jgi:hypothetical protein
MSENDMLLLGCLLFVGILALAKICYDVLYEGDSRGSET